MSLFIQEQPLQVLPTLACAIGLERAIVLQQIHQWTADEQLVKMDYGKWQTAFSFWSKEAFQQILLDLETMNLLTVQVIHGETMCSVNQEQLKLLIQQNFRGIEL